MKPPSPAGNGWPEGAGQGQAALEQACRAPNVLHRRDHQRPHVQNPFTEERTKCRPSS